MQSCQKWTKAKTQLLFECILNSCLLFILRSILCVVCFINNVIQFNSISVVVICFQHQIQNNNHLTITVIVNCKCVQSKKENKQQRNVSLKIFNH
eukprot:m.41995 g.41995  ORF g.41995 m.41995 type:complete len:95 (+) comp10479_c0_seq1:355-639(+)